MIFATLFAILKCRRSGRGVSSFISHLGAILMFCCFRGVVFFCLCLDLGFLLFCLNFAWRQDSFLFFLTDYCMTVKASSAHGRSSKFFLAHAVRAPGSDGHQRFVVGQLFSVCKRTGEKQKAGCLRKAKQASSNTNQQTQTIPHRKDIQETKRNKTTLSEQ